MIIPNAFQTPNIVIDRAMKLLTDSEFRVYMYAIRHILGWQDKINRRQGFISLRLFERGFTTQDGAIYDGCGVGRGAIIAALDKLTEYGLLLKIGTPTESGQKWEIAQDGIQWEALEKRHEQTRAKRRQQTRAATEIRQGGTLDVPVTLDDTMSGTLNVTTPGTLDVPNQSHVSKPDSKPQRDKRATGVSHKPYPKSYNPRLWTEAHITRFWQENQFAVSALIAARGDNALFPTLADMVKGDAVKYIEAASELSRLGCPPSQFESLAVYTRATTAWRKRPYTLADMLNCYADWRKSRERGLEAGRHTPIQPADDTEPEPEDTAALKAAREAIRPTWEVQS